MKKVLIIAVVMMVLLVSACDGLVQVDIPSNLPDKFRVDLAPEQMTFIVNTPTSLLNDHVATYVGTVNLPDPTYRIDGLSLFINSVDATSGGIGYFGIGQSCPPQHEMALPLFQGECISWGRPANDSELDALLNVVKTPPWVICATMPPFSGRFVLTLQASVEAAAGIKVQEFKVFEGELAW